MKIAGQKAELAIAIVVTLINVSRILEWKGVKEASKQDNTLQSNKNYRQ